MIKSMSNKKNENAKIKGQHKQYEQLEQYEIERKFLVKRVDLPKNLKSYKSKKLVQGFLSIVPCLRVRKSGADYYFTIKTKPNKKFDAISDLVRNEYEVPIPKKTFDALIKKCVGKVIYKTRYYIPYGTHTIELDIFEKDFKGLIYAECEFESVLEAKKFIVPSWFYKDVTGINKYKNTELSVCKNIKNILKY